MTTAFVGRAREFGLVLETVDGAVAGRGGVVLLAGEPGIGKSRLAEQAAAHGRSRGAAVFWGRCWDGDAAPGYWPWIQVIRSLLRAHGSALLDAPGIDRREIARLIPTGDRPDEPEGTRFRLFDAVAGLLRAAGERRPVVLILDDLHWGDTPSLALLRFLARELRDDAVAILGAYRDVADHPLAAVLGELTGECRHVVLRGLDPSEVAELVAAVTGTAPAGDAAAALHRSTGGNPFFVRELADVPAALPGDVLAALPGGVRAVITRRVSQLPEPCARLLDAAAVLGQEFDLDLLAAVANQPPDRAARLTSEAARARILEPSGDRLRFTHALTREALYAELSPAQRIELHARCAAAIEERLGRDPDEWLAQLAQHLWQAGTDPRKAADYAVRAGQQAMATLAYEDAARHFARAAGILESNDPLRRCDLLLLLGQAQMSAADLEAARATFHRAATFAQRAGAPDRVAQAALAVGVEYGFGIVDGLEVRLLETALANLAETEPGLRARLMARLAKALLFTPDEARRTQLGAEAVALARHTADPDVLGWVLFDRHVVSWTSATPRDRLAVAAEIVRLARNCADLGLEVRGRALLLANLQELADIAGYHAELRRYERLIREHRLVQLGWQVPLLQATQALIAGRFADAERLATEGVELGRHVEQPSVELYALAVVVLANLWQGRAAQAEPLLQAVGDQAGSVPAIRSAWAAVLVETDRVAQARVEFERLAADDFAHVPRDLTWLLNASALATVCHCLDDRRRAVVLYDLLLPHAPHLVRANHVGVACSAPVAYFLGLLALTQDRPDLAETHLAEAVAISERIGAPVFAANARHKLADAVAMRNPDRAARLRREAGTILDALGIPPVFRAGQGATTGVAVLRPEGDYWEVGQADRTVRIRGSVGLRYLARLLAEPGREFHTLDLASGHRIPSDLGPILDSQAKSAYRRRLAELAEELQEAEEFGDNSRAESARVQIDALTKQLAAAVGLGGRDRPAGATTERARSAVTKALKTAVARITEHDPVLGGHLARSVRTGTYCAYVPDPTASITWNVP